jgi:colanic acid biosynthesis glycosyl transferase WcaI
MKILLYGINFAPELTGIGKYTGEMAAWLAAQGHEVRVVTAPPYYPAWKVGDGFSGTRWQRHTWQGVQVWRCPLWVPAAPGGVKRLLHLASFALSSLPVLLRQVLWRADVVWVVEPALFCAPAAWGVARLGRSKAWLHVQDFEVDAAFSLNLLKGQRIKNAVLAAERWLMRRFDLVSSISSKMISRLHQKGVSPSRTVLAPNWVDISAITPRPADAGPSPFKAELGLPAHVVVALYSGNMGGKQGLEVMAEAAKLCQSYEKNRSSAQVDTAQAAISFVFCGNGAGRADLQARCVNLSNVRFLDLQPMARLNDLLALADVHLLPQRADAADLVMPSKLTGMLASGRAVIATAHQGTELAAVVTGDTLDTCCGVVVPPEEPALLAQALVNLANSPAERARMGANGRRYAERYLHTDAVLGRLVERMAHHQKRHPKVP